MSSAKGVQLVDVKRSTLMQVPYGQEINIQNMNVELVAQMFKNYRSNVLFHLEGMRAELDPLYWRHQCAKHIIQHLATDSLQDPS